jgi:hypothetical protein
MAEARDPFVDSEQLGRAGLKVQEPHLIARNLKRGRVKPGREGATSGRMSLCQKPGIAVSRLKRGSLTARDCSQRNEIAAQAQNIK